MSGNEKTRSPLAPIGASLRRVYALPALGRLLTMVMTAVVALTVVIGYSGAAIAAPKTVVITCNNPNASSIQDAVDNATGPTIIRFVGLCEGDVTVRKDDITLDGNNAGTVSGTISFVGANRGVLKNSTVTGPGRGVEVARGATVNLHDNIIDGNESYGVIVTDGSYLRFDDNTVTDNGRAAFFEAGMEVLRAVVTGLRNVYSNNHTTGVEVFNMGQYRTGAFVFGGAPNNDGPFEMITASGDQFALAIGLGQMSFGDFRQVMITGNVNVGFKSMLQVRGDSAGPDLFCSEIDGDVRATATLAQARIRFTNVTGNLIGAFFDGDSLTPLGVCPNP